MPADKASLSTRLELFTTDELLAEVARRARALKEQVEGVTLCDGCIHQVFWKGRGDPPASFKDCGLRHATEFKMPDDDDPHGDGAGFYRPGGCPDRAEPVPAPAPTPAPEPPPIPRGGRPTAVT